MAPILSYNVPDAVSYSGKSFIALQFPDWYFQHGIGLPEGGQPSGENIQPAGAGRILSTVDAESVGLLRSYRERALPESAYVVVLRSGVRHIRSLGASMRCLTRAWRRLRLRHLWRGSAAMGTGGREGAYLLAALAAGLESHRGIQRLKQGQGKSAGRTASPLATAASRPAITAHPPQHRAVEGPISRCLLISA
jgi:hypothetical protein